MKSIENDPRSLFNGNHFPSNIPYIECVCMCVHVQIGKCLPDFVNVLLFAGVPKSCTMETFH